MYSIVQWHAVLSVAKALRNQMAFVYFLDNFPKEEHAIILDILSDIGMIENTWFTGHNKYIWIWTSNEDI